MKEFMLDNIKVKKFSGNIKVQVFFAEDCMYFRTKPGFVRVKTNQRRYLHRKPARVNGVLFPWACAYRYAEEILEQNASLRAKDGEIEYLNPARVTFYKTGSGAKMYKSLSYACIKAFVLAGTELERMMTNLDVLDTNILEYAIPVFQGAHLSVLPGKEGRLCMEGFNQEDIKKILSHAEKLKDDKSIGMYTREWVSDVLIPALTGYLSGLNMAQTDFEKVYEDYSNKVAEVNDVLKQHESEFDFSDEDVFRMDCGYTTIGFADERLSKLRMILANDTRTKYKVPEIKLPRMVQSLTIQFREFEKAQRIVKSALGLDIVILESHLD